MISLFSTTKLRTSMFLILILPNICFAQLSKDTLNSVIIEDAKSTMIHSSIVGDSFKIYFHFPPGYDTSKMKYPVLYLTDGDWLFSMAINCFNMLRQDYVTKETIIVGIGYGDKTNNRSRDLIPSNGAEKFLEFISKELIPYVQEHFRTSQERTLYGYSLGGMFSTYVLFQQPELFTNILIGAPGNIGNDLIPSADTYFKTHKTLTASIFLSVGSYEPLVVTNIVKFKNFMLAKKLPGLKIETVVIEGANHGAAQAAVMQQAILFAYCKHYTPIKISSNIINSLAGKYTSPTNTKQYFNLVARNNRLFWQLGAGFDVVYELFPESETSFFMYQDQTTLYSFKNSTDNSTKILTLTLRDGNTLEFKKPLK